MAEKCEFEERVCVDCEITVDCQCDLAKKKNLKKIRLCKAFFRALRNSLCFRSPLVTLSQSLGREKAQLQTPNQTVGSYTELSMVVKFSWVSISKCLSGIPLGVTHCGAGAWQANARQICVRSEMQKT